MEIKIYWMRYISGLLQKAFVTVDHEILLSKLTIVLEVHQITGLKPTFLIANNLFL